MNRYERRLAEAKVDSIGVMKAYKRDIDLQQARMNASKNGFVRTCCQQEIDRLTAEKKAIDMEVNG